MMIEVLSYGGGTQTMAMCCLVVEGKLPHPDRIVMADTGREVASTFDYLEKHAGPLLATVGLKVEIAPHTLATVDLYAHNGDLLLPVFTATGKFSAYCSNEWKKRVTQRYLRSLGIQSARNWIGYSHDERERWKAGPVIEGPWPTRFPLVDLLVTKFDCQQIIKRHGNPLPKKSRCVMCPHQPNEEWRELPPEEFEAACVIDEEIREEDGEHAVYLHESRVPLRQANLTKQDRKTHERQCTLGMCFI